ncbi:X-ray radiation resistance-associated protein 1 [Clinocottus analis]|uniref:X-ray radiation resistance-associated protein 1 n=1 Tax=Clinocottus analis TaxID=304258 RepID=UPI0035BF7DA7
MAAASCKLDDGQSIPTKSFPPRALHQRRKEGAGHWLVDYGKTEEQQYRKVQRRRKDTSKECNNKTCDNTLDRLFLLQLHCVDKPSELCSVDVSEQKLNSVKAEDLKLFDNVAYIDASINFLSLGSFSSFVSLRELNLSLNGLCNMTFHAADFPHLQVLDLSYNSLSADDIASFGHLPRLKVLHLTGNQLHQLPPDLGPFNDDPTQPAKEDDPEFRALEVLMLDDNKLSSGVFNSLRNLQRLKYLNLHGNLISEIPYLQLKPWPTSVEEQAEEEGLAHTETRPNPVEEFKKISQEHRKRSRCPLPELQFLNLADNEIAEEEALMAVALFPKLREIDIHSNPLTTQRSGDLPLLTYYLHERLGIAIKHKQTQMVAKRPLTVSADPKWKVEERIPKVSKKLLLMEAPYSAQSEMKKKAESEGEHSEDDTFQENTKHFFVTQATDVPEYEFGLPADEKQTAGNQERLMDVKASPDVVEPIGIQTAVRMLEHTLKNLNVYRDSKPKLDSIQMPYKERERREPPPVKPIKLPAERVDEMIKEIKESTTISEVPLSCAIQGIGVNKQEQKEALSLLRDFKTKHKMVHKKTMDQAATFESDMNTNQVEAEPPPVQMLPTA